MRPSGYKKNLEYIKAVGIDEPTMPREDLQNASEIEGGILDYVCKRMGCEHVTREVVREAVAFEKEMSRMQGW